MNNIIYDYADSMNGLMLVVYALLILGGAGVVFYGFCIMPKKECEFDGKPMKLKNVPISFRLIMQGIPVVLGLAALLGGALNLYDMYRCDIHYDKGNVQQVTGELSEVQIYWNPFDEDADLAVLSPESLETFEDFLTVVEAGGGHVYVQRVGLRNFNLAPLTVAESAADIEIRRVIPERQ